MIELTAERLRTLLHYDPETGVFRVAIQTNPRMKIGDIAGTINRNGYRYIMADRKTYSAHRLAWLYIHGAWPFGDIDHMNGLPDDNRIANLRDVTEAMNAQNERRPRKSNTSGFMGVRWRKDRHCWIAVILIGGKTKRLGSFDSREAAHDAYLIAKRAHHPGFLL